MERALDLAMARADKAELYVVDREETPIEFKFDKLHSLSKKYTKGVGLRVIKDGRIGFSSTTDPSRLDGLVENALQSAKYGQRSAFDFPESGRYPHVKALSERVRGFPTQAGIEEGRKAISMIKEVNKGISSEVHISRSLQRVSLVNSDGLNAEFEKSSFSYWIEGLAIIDGSFVWLYEGKNSSDLCLETEGFVRSLLKKAELAEKVLPLAAKRMPVIFAPQAMPSLLYALLLGVNGKNVQKGSSPLVGRIGEGVLDENFSLYDDSTLDHGYRTVPFDGEGIPSQRTALFEKGILKGYIFDLQTAGILGERSTGNGVRDFHTQPSPAHTNVLVEPGDWTLEEMVSDVKEGIIVHNVLGGGQSNLLAGDFSLNLSLAYKVEDGEIVGRVKDCMVAGNVYEAFKEIVAIGEEAEETWGLYTPPFYFRSMMVASKT